MEEVLFTKLINEDAEKITNPDALAIWFDLRAKQLDNATPSYIRARWNIGRDRYHNAMRELRELGLIWDLVVRNKADGKIITRRLRCK